MYVQTVTSGMGFFVLSVAVYISEDIFDVIWDKAGLSMPGSLGGGVVVLIAFSALGIPALVFLNAVPLAALLARAEGWTFMNGFWWSVSAQLGGGLSMVGDDVDFTQLGSKLIGTLAAAGSIGQSVVSVELSGAPIMEPVMELLGMTLPDLEEIELDLFGSLSGGEGLPAREYSGSSLLSWASLGSSDEETSSSGSSGSDEEVLAESQAVGSSR
jgi:hypothetical protein